MPFRSIFRQALTYAKRLRVFLYLILGLVAVEVLVSTGAETWRAYRPVLYRERVEACRKGRWDLVLVGGSPAMSGLDADILAGAYWQGQALDRVFNLSLPLATTAEIRLAVEHGVACAPRLLVYGITITDLNEDRVEPQGPRELMNARDCLQRISGQPEAAPWCLRQFMKGQCERSWQLYQHGDGIRLWAADHVERLWPGLCPDTAAEACRELERGRMLRSNRGISNKPPAPPELRLDRLKATGSPIPPFTFLDHFAVKHYLTDLRRLLAWCQARRIPVVLLNMPVPADLEQHYRREFALYRSVLDEVERTHDVRVLRPARSAVGLTDADFTDLVHLNGDGCARLSTWLRDMLTGL